jgi:hypothetical protein
MTKALLAPVLACVLAAGSASAQTSVSVRAGQVSSPVVPVLPFSAAPGGANLVSPLSSLGLTPSLSAPSITASPEILPVAAALQPAALAAAVQPVAMIASKVVAVKAAAVEPNAPALTVLSAASVGETKGAAYEAKLGVMFDGDAPRAGGVSAVAAPLASPSRGFLGKAALAAGVFMAHPAIALASTGAQVVTEPAALSLVLSYGPFATMIAAVLGALFGLWSARGKDGAPADIGQVFAYALSHGAIAGAAAFTLLDLTKIAFVGTTAAALTPLTAAVTTAALAQAAFAAKFMDPATTPASRIMGAFPAVAMAFGLSIGAATMLPAATMLTVGTAALMATGAATALFTALFRLDKSPAAGPAAMGRGFVLQALMTGLALAVSPGPYAFFFFALAAWGFASVMLATVREVWAAVPDRFKP